MKILIYGLGAIGSVYASALSEAGHRVWAWDLVDVIEKIKNREVKITGVLGTHTSRLEQIISSMEQLDNYEFDLIIIALKAYDTKTAAQNIKSLVNRNNYVLLGQNGYGNYEAASEAIPKENIIVARIIFGAETLQPGYAKVTVIADKVTIGNPDKLIDEQKLKEWASLISTAGVPTKTVPDIMKSLWGKILYNSILNPLGAILEVNYGALIADLGVCSIIDQMIDEIFAVLKMEGQEVDWRSPEEYKTYFYQKLMPSTGAHLPSMLYDIRNGRKTEIDALNGALSCLGAKHNVPTPANDLIIKLLKAKEQMAFKFVER
ncbi:MAG: ketopantoate reductase family protein [Syntrophomonadaceae bacterium]|nr:ketopantoate reductase family protein [Syntrophomonadaceae bacterium]